MKIKSQQLKKNVKYEKIFVNKKKLINSKENYLRAQENNHNQEKNFLNYFHLKHNLIYKNHLIKIHNKIKNCGKLLRN